MTKRRNSSGRRRQSAASRRKQSRFWIMAALGVAAAVWAMAPQSGLMAEKESGPEPTTNSDINRKHYDGLDRVTVPSALPSQIKEYEGFTVSFNNVNKTPNWVSWELLADETDGTQSRADKFWSDTTVDGCPQTSDYTRSGYDRGHMCPAADQKWSTEAMWDCFSMANMCPQDHSLNSGAWATLESKERVWAQRDSAIIIVAGPIYDVTDNKTIGKAGVRVPGAFFKVLLAPYIESPRAIGFVYPNMSSPGNMQQYAMSVDEVEQITGFDFFSSLPDDIEQKVESEASFKDWDARK